MPYKCKTSFLNHLHSFKKLGKMITPFLKMLRQVLTNRKGFSLKILAFLVLVTSGIVLVEGIEVSGPSRVVGECEKSPFYSTLPEETLFLEVDRNTGVEIDSGELVVENATLSQGREARAKVYKITTQTRLLIIGSVVLGGILASYGYLTQSRIGKCLQKFPGVTTFPIFGSILCVLATGSSSLTSIAPLLMKKGRTARFWIFHTPVVILAEASSIEKIASSLVHINKSDDYEHFHWIMGEGLVTGNGQKWVKDRKLLNPCFKFGNFDRFLSVFETCSKIFLRDVENEVVKNQNNPIDVFALLNRCTLDSIMLAAFEHTSVSLEDSDLIHSVETVVKTLEVRITKPWLCLPIISEIFGPARTERSLAPKLKEAISKEINHRNDKLELQSREKRADSNIFLDVLINSGKDNLEIVYQLFTLIGAGFETTGSAMNYTLYLLAINPECQAKVHQELDALFGDEIDRDLTLGDMSRLTYLEMCIKESMRIYPPVPLVARKTGEEIMLDDGLIIPRGVNVAFLIHLLHQDPRVFPDPEKFNPDRFLPAACANRNPYSYMPFSMGPRNCIGQKYAMMQMKTVLSHVLRRFQVSSDIKQGDFSLIYGGVLRTTKDITIRLKHRV